MKWIWVIVFLILTVVAYRVMFPSVTLRYRLVIEAEVDGARKTGAGVIEVTYSKQSEFAAQHPLVVSYRGEAVVLDLGIRGIMFALLRAGKDDRSSPEWIVLRAFNFPGGAVPQPIENGLKQIQQLTGKRELPLASLPLLVRFRDPVDPKSVEEVDPLDMVASFGPGVRITRATIEIVPAGIWPLNSYGFTGEPLTTGIAKKLIWLSGYYDRRLDGQRFGAASSVLPLANSLSSGAFKAGL